ncbi:MAG: isochorismatase family protein [Planctomycetes bacterium]|nr:isochorismatase family protein [Planctomycetota bacterium]
MARKAGIVLCLCSLGFGAEVIGGTIKLTVQRHDADGRAVQEGLRIDPARTVVVVVDMWDRHWCKTYTARVGNLVPRMNRTLDAARRLGIQVVHAPSDVVGFYRDAPQRKAMLAIPAQPPPKAVPFEPPAQPCGKDCCECGPDRPCRPGGVWTRQHPDLKIAEGDLIADCNNGRELTSLCAARGVTTLIYMGVASNMCVLYRSCGIINMKRQGLQALFVCDLVEAITANGCDPATKQKDLSFTPAKGSALIQRYLEEHVAPSIESRQLIAAASPGAQDKRPLVVFVISEPEYDTKSTLPAFAEKHLAKGFRCTFVQANPKDGNDLPGLDALYDADLLVLSVRRRALPVVQMDHLERFIRSGKPLVALRTSCVPFAAGSAPAGHVVWEGFDREVLGCTYQGYDAESRRTGCDVWAVPDAADHPVLRGLASARFHSRSWLYKMLPLAEGAKPLMMGRWAEDKPAQPVAWTASHAGGRVFYTSLGHSDDFAEPTFTRLLTNALHWALALPSPER